MRITLFGLFLAASSLALGSTFDTHFEDATLRIDYFRSGDAATEVLTFDRALRQGCWAGSRQRLSDPFPYGRSIVRVTDPTTGEELFSRGFDAYFDEYRTTAVAHQGSARTFHESVLLPFPRHPIQVTIELRAHPSGHQPLARWTIDPNDIAVASEEPAEAKIFNQHVPAPPPNCLDVAFLGEGFTAAEVDLFEEDLKRFSEVMLKQEPYASMRDSICIRGVLAPSADSGCDEPTRGQWKRTALGASFNALGSERYLLTEDNRSLRDIAANVPYDALIVMVNHERYGGGGIYNLFCVFTTGNRWSPYLVLHEFGHSFSGLADEYYTSSVAYEDLLPPGTEPIAPNVTALLDPASLKWRDLVDDTTPLPTPWRKEAYDTMDLAYQAQREELNRAIGDHSRAGDTAIADRLKAKEEEISSHHAEKMRAFLAEDPMAGTVGAFEGAGYATTGLYRPTLDCLMFSRARQPFCPVCRRAVARMVQRYIDTPPKQE
jgi:hypothetical protein